MAASGAGTMLDMFGDVRSRTVPRLLEAAARQHGSRPFLQHGTGDPLRFADAFDAARAVSAGLGRLGVGQGNVIPMMLPNGPEFVLSWFGIALRGAAYIGINTSLVGDVLAAQLALAESRLWIVHYGFLPVLEALPAALRASVEVLVVIDLPQGEVLSSWQHVVRFDALLRETAAPPVATVGFTDVGALTFTSGTTGASKGVMTTQAQAVTTALSWMRLVDLYADDVIYTPLPLFHGMSSRMGILPAPLTGCRVVLDDRFSGSSFWARCSEADATVAHTIFTIPNVLLAQPPGPADRAHRVTRMFNGHHSDAFEARFGVRLVEAFATSEIGIVTGVPVTGPRSASAGAAVPDWEVRVVDEDGLPVPDGTPGEIVCRPRLPGIMMRGYLNQLERTVEAWRDLWYRTGDIARRDADGNFWFLDRAKERIRRRGENISSWEIEQAALAHPAVQDAAAVAHPAQAGEDDIRLLVVLRPGHVLPERELHAWLGGKLPRFMVPRYVEVTERLPYTATNKVEKSRLMAAGLAPHAWDAEAATSQGDAA